MPYIKQRSGYKLGVIKIMKYQEWKLIAESIGSGMTLGLSQPNVIGGPIGSHFAEEEFEDGDDVEDSEEDGDGPSFPPEDSSEMDEKGSSCSASKKFMSKKWMGDEDMGDEDMGDEDMGDDDMGDDDMGDEDDDKMNFLKDIDPTLMGDESGDDAGIDQGDINAEPVVDDKSDMHRDTMDLMKKMAAYCGKYMKAEAKHMHGEDPECEPEVKPAKADKDHKKADKKHMKHMKKSCQCEGDEFTNSLVKSMGTKKTMQEDALFTSVEPSESDNTPGSVGFAPQGRIGSIGGGYTKDDFSDIPVLGESNRFPTLTEWQAMRNLRKK